MRGLLRRVRSVARPWPALITLRGNLIASQADRSNHSRAIFVIVPAVWLAFAAIRARAQIGLQDIPLNFAIAAETRLRKKPPAGGFRFWS